MDPEYPWGGAPCGPLLVAPNGAIDVLFEDYNITGASHALGLGYNYFTRSTDGGVLWSTPVALSDYSFPNDVWWIDGAITEDRSGSLYATYDSVNATADTAWVAISRDGGTTWTPSIQVNPDTNAAAHNLVEGAGGENGTVYVAWMTNASGSEVTDEAPLSGNGTTWGPVVQVSDQPGLAGLWIGDTLGISYVGGGRVAVSWSYGVYQAGFAGSQVFAAVLNETAPGAPSITGVTPGTADLQVDWAQPSGASPVAGYLVAWGFEGGNESNATVGPTNRSFVVHGLMAFADYHVNVSAFNAAGAGPPSPSVRFTLQPWTRVSGTVAPISASVWLDSAPESVADGAYTVLTSYTTHLVTVSAMNYG
ncbi:MAG: fibronectin type III domain-containing protein, partial [Thermoplasmata archaeon]|nr:fibronectin type III domain-containing protein [Thermoplasmata archaeon]